LKFLNNEYCLSIEMVEDLALRRLDYEMRVLDVILRQRILGCIVHLGYFKFLRRYIFLFIIQAAECVLKVE